MIETAKAMKIWTETLEKKGYNLESKLFDDIHLATLQALDWQANQLKEILEIQRKNILELSKEVGNLRDKLSGEDYEE